MTGYLEEKRRIDAINLALIALALLYVAWLLMPEVFDRLELFELAGFKLELRQRVREMEQIVSTQDKRIDQLIQLAMSPIIFKHLCGIACCKEYLYQHMTLVQRETYYLKDHGFIALKPGHETVEFDERLNKQNLVAVAEATAAGWEIIRLRKGEIPEWIKGDWLRRDLPTDILEALSNRR